MQTVFSRLSRWLSRGNASPLSCIHAMPDSWCAMHLPAYAPQKSSPRFQRIEQLAEQADAKGPQPLWEGYSAIADYPVQIGGNATRRAHQVRTRAMEGAFFSWPAQRKKATAILEFGAAFGVSGMYWLAGLEANGDGRLYSFEPNTVWGDIAAKNLAAISPRFQLTLDTFENHAPRMIAEGIKIDIAFIDAIHTSEFVNRQLALVLQLAAPGAVIIFDDINFSDDMRQCWQDISRDRRFVAAYTLAQRTGIVETPASHP